MFTLKETMPSFKESNNNNMKMVVLIKVNIIIIVMITSTCSFMDSIFIFTNTVSTLFI